MLQKEVFDSIKDELDNVEHYRTEICLRYPDNVKNPRAVKALKKLSSRLHYATGVDWEAIQTIFDTDPRKFKEIVSRVARRVGSKNHQKPSPGFFLRSIALEFRDDKTVAA